MTISIHDHKVRELTVSAADRTIRIGTAYPEMAGPERGEVLLEGVEGYAFNGDALSTILFDIEGVDPLALYREWPAQMQHAYSKTGGHAPVGREGCGRACVFSSGKVRSYRVSSSIGLEGAAWARKLTVRAITSELADHQD